MCNHTRNLYPEHEDQHEPRSFFLLQVAQCDIRLYQSAKEIRQNPTISV